MREKTIKKKTEKEFRQPLNWKKEVRLLPGYLVVSLWVLFTIAILVWIFAASLSTTKEIYQGNALKFLSGFHWENYVNAWQLQNVSIYFLNSFIYATVSCVLLILIGAPAAYVLARYTFLGNKVMKSGLVMAMSIPAIMIILPLLNITTGLKLNGSRTLLIFLYTAVNIPYTVTFLLNFFSTLSKSYEEAAALDGCTRSRHSGRSCSRWHSRVSSP